MPDTMRLDNVPGSHIVFRNFRGKPTPVTKGGDRNFCLIIPNRLIRDQLAARGCNIKKLKNKAIIDGEKLNDIEFVNIAVRITPKENEGDIWTLLDTNNIDNAWLEFSFYEYNINGKKGTRIYLRNAKFFIKEYFESLTIRIGMPDMVRIVNNTNNTEETNMEKIMSVEEIISRFGVLEYVYNSCKSEDKKALKDIMEAVRAAKYYLMPGSAHRCERLNRPTTDNKPMITGYELEKTGDFASIKQVIFNGPATVVIWSDDVKTVVKCQEGDTFDKEKGLAMAICKRLYGNESNFNNLIKKWTEPNVKKAERQAQVEANKTAKGKSKADKKKDLDKARKNDKTMVVLTDAYRTKLRIKMAEKGWTYAQLAEKAGLGKSTVTRLISTAKQKFMPTKIRRDVFNKLNNALGIRWKE